MRTTAAFLAVLFLTALALAEEPTAGRLVVNPDAFATLVNPNCSHCIDESKRRAADLRADDRVLCWTRGKYDGGAIPIRFFLNPYRVISDTYGVFVYDPDAGYARGFKPSLDFRFHGWRNGVMVMKRKDGTLFSCLSGVAFDGPGKGEHLATVPTLVSDWGFWSKQYPGTVAYRMFEKYKPTELPTKPNADALKSRGPVDKRLPADEMVLGVVVGQKAHAYRLSDLAKMGKYAVLEDGDRLILWYGPTRTAAAYSPEAWVESEPGSQEAADVRLSADGKSAAAPFVDKGTDSRFDITGRAVEGKHKGAKLGPLDGVMVKWFAWSAEYPRTTLFQPKAD